MKTSGRRCSRLTCLYCIVGLLGEAYKDVAGMAMKIPWIKLYLADADVSPDWSLQPAEQLMFSRQLIGDGS